LDVVCTDSLNMSFYGLAVDRSEAKVRCKTKIDNYLWLNLEQCSKERSPMHPVGNDDQQLMRFVELKRELLRGRRSGRISDCDRRSKNAR
jgi:hypothetical protein